jgi:hypothetical protein
MKVVWQKLPRIVRAYLLSILIWGVFGPLMAGQEKWRMHADGAEVSYWSMLLISWAWCVTAASLSPIIFRIVRS